MKLFKLGLFTLLFLTACGSNEQVLKIAQPNFAEDQTNEANYHIEGATTTHTIEDQEIIDKIANIIENAEKIDEPVLVKQTKPKVIMEIYNQKENTSELKRTVWLSTDGVILENPSGEYFQIPVDQAELLINNLNI